MPPNCYNVPQNWSQHFSFFFFFSQLSRTSYPLCMRQLHTALKENHHLKHGGRLQYGLFLKVSCKHLPLCLRLKTNLTPTQAGWDIKYFWGWHLTFLDVSFQGIGLSLEEALIFWRAEFTKLMDVDKVQVLVGEHFVTCSTVESSSCFFLSGSPFQCTCVWVRDRLIGHKS